MIYRLSLAQPQLQKRVRRQNAAQLLFLFCLHSEKEVGMQVSLVTMSHPSPCLPLDIKNSLKEDVGVF
jgi:hypothetical protein